MAIIYTKWLLNTPNGRKIHQMAIKFTNNTHFMALQNTPDCDFWYRNLPPGNPGWKLSEDTFLESAPHSHAR
jgi:hypothetical protein